MAGRCRFEHGTTQDRVPPDVGLAQGPLGGTSPSTPVEHRKQEPEGCGEEGGGGWGGEACGLRGGSSNVGGWEGGGTLQRAVGARPTFATRGHPGLRLSVFVRFCLRECEPDQGLPMFLGKVLTFSVGHPSCKKLSLS